MNKAGFRLPAEWERQSATLLAWPHDGTDWQNDLAAIQKEYAVLIDTILRYQTCVLLVPPGGRQAPAGLGERAGLHFLEIPFNDTWCRDYGPITLVHGGERLALDFFFNGWGGKFPAQLDNRVNTHLARHAWFDRIRFRQYLFELEGGAIDSNGQGCLLINRHNLRLRHSYLDDAEIDHELHAMLGVDSILGIDLPAMHGDDTDGHIDTLARFIAPGRIAFQLQREGSRNDMLRSQIEALRDAQGQSFELIALPVPDDTVCDLPVSYANFLFVNDALLVPAFGLKSDREALAILQAALPDRKIEPVPARAMIGQAGGPHCASMHIPAALG